MIIIKNYYLTMNLSILIKVKFNYLNKTEIANCI